MLLLHLWGSKGKLALSVLLICAVIFELACCQEEQRTTPGRKVTLKKRKTGKSAKPKTKATPAAQTQTFITQVLDAGTFKKAGETISVPTGETLELRCRGKPVQWGVPSYLEEDHDGRLRTVQHERYGVLTLVNTTGADTGEYTCFPMYCEDTDCRKEYGKAVKVFVFFPDPQELFVPSSNYYEVIQLRTNWPTVLPCQVTSPEAKVTLHREFPPVEVAADGTEISFNVKKGFTIHRPRPHHAGALFCVASLGSLRQSSTKYMLIYVNYPMAPPAPVIQASSNSVVIGENLRVSCTVVAEQDVAVEFTWDYPGQQIGRPPYTQESVGPVSGGTARKQAQSVLLVDEVRDVDKGTYTCTAQNCKTPRPEFALRSRSHSGQRPCSIFTLLFFLLCRMYCKRWSVMHGRLQSSRWLGLVGHCPLIRFSVFHPFSHCLLLIPGLSCYPIFSFLSTFISARLLMNETTPHCSKEKASRSCT